MAAVPPAAVVGPPAPPNIRMYQNTAPSVVDKPDVSSHTVKSSPMELMSVEPEPSTTPTVSHESNSASGMALKKAGLTPPTFVPKGAAT